MPIKTDIDSEGDGRFFPRYRTTSGTWEHMRHRLPSGISTPNWYFRPLSINGPGNNDKPLLTLVRTAFSMRKSKRSGHTRDRPLFDSLVLIIDRLEKQLYSLSLFPGPLILKPL